MPTSSLVDIVHATTWLIGQGVDVRSWPDRTSPDLHRPVVEDRPTVYLILEPGSFPPHWGDHIEWVEVPVEFDTLVRRTEELCARFEASRSAARIDASGALWVGGRSVQLTAAEGVLVTYLLGRMGEVVSREELATALWPAGFHTGRTAVDARVRAAARRVARVGLRLHTIRGRGFLLEVDGEHAATG